MTRLQGKVKGQPGEPSREVMLQLLKELRPVALVTRAEARQLMSHLSKTGHCSLRDQLLVSVAQSNVESVVSDIMRRKVHPALCFLFLQVTGYVWCCVP